MLKSYDAKVLYFHTNSWQREAKIDLNCLDLQQFLLIGVLKQEADCITTALLRRCSEFLLNSIICAYR